MEKVKIKEPSTEVPQKDLYTKSGTQSFTPPPSGIDPIPVQKKSPLSIIQEKKEEESTENFTETVQQKELSFAEEEPPVYQTKAKEESEDNSLEEPAPFIPHSQNKLPQDIQAKMEQSFNADFSDVNIHEGNNATQIGALAYTQGNDIHFAPGQFQPYSHKGQELIGHELAHVIQQREGRVQPTIQKKGMAINDSKELEKEADEMGIKAANGILVNQEKKSGNGKPLTQMKPIQMKNGEDDPKPGVTFLYRVYVQKAMNPEELLIHFVKQYYKTDTETAKKLIVTHGWAWTSENPSGASDKDAANGYVDITVTDRSLKPISEEDKKEAQKIFEGLTKEEKEAINKEVDKQFWQKTNYKEGQKLDPSSKLDKLQVEYWKRIRAKLLEQKVSLDKLPITVKEFLRSPETFKPENYERLLSIASILEQFDASDFSDYKSKVNAETTDLAELERSLLRYLEEKQKRKEATEEREKIATKLYGLEELYRKYRLYKTMLSTPVVMSPYAGPNMGSAYASMKMREELETNAKRNGFASLTEFEASIKSYEEAFKKETIAIGFDALAKYEHILFEEEKKYKDLNNVNKLFQQISPAKTQYEEADRESTNAILSGISTRDHISDAQLERQLEHASKSRSAKEKGDAIVTANQDEKSILREEKFNKKAAGSASTPEELQKILIEYIAAKKESIRETRNNIQETNLIFKLPKLLETSYVHQGIAKNSIYDMIISDKVSEIKVQEFMLNLAIAVFSIALGLVTFGAGTALSIAAGATAFGISAWQAYEEYKEYAKMKDAAAVEFAEDPSLVWVIVAIAGAGLDLAAVSASVKAIAAPAKLFNENKDLIKFEKALSQISDLDIRSKQKVLEAAIAEKQFHDALNDMVKSSGKLYSTFIGDPEVFYHFVRAAFYAAKRGIIKFEKYLIELRKSGLIKDLEKLTPEELGKLKEAFEQGSKEFKETPTLYDDLGEVIEIEVKAGKTLEEIKGSLKSRISAEPQRFELKLTDDQLDKAIAEGRAKDLDDKTIEDIIFQGSRKGKGLSYDEVIQQMDNTVKIKAQGYPVLFKSAEEFQKFKSEVVISTLKKLGLPTTDVRIQGSLLRKTNIDEIGDIDIGIVMKKEEFEHWINKFHKESALDKKKKDVLKAKEKGIITANDMIFPEKGGILKQVYEQYEIVMGKSAPKKIQISIILQDGKFDLNPYMPF